MCKTSEKLQMQILLLLEEQLRDVCQCLIQHSPGEMGYALKTILVNLILNEI